MRRNYWRLIAWNGKQRAGYVILDDDVMLFTNDWRLATTFPTREAWNATRDAIRRMGCTWSSTPLNAPRSVPDEEVAA